METTRKMSPIVFGTKLLFACDLYIGEADSSSAWACSHIMGPIIKGIVIHKINMVDVFLRLSNISK